MRSSPTTKLLFAAICALAAPSARAADEEIRIGACQPITGRFAFAGAQLNAGLADYLAYANEQGIVKGKKLVYIYEDTGYDTEKAVATFKKMMAQHSPVIMYGESTGQGKAIAPELNSRYKVLYGSTSFSSELADPKTHPRRSSSARTCCRSVAATVAAGASTAATALATSPSPNSRPCTRPGISAPSRPESARRTRVPAPGAPDLERQPRSRGLAHHRGGDFRRPRHGCAGDGHDHVPLTQSGAQGTRAGRDFDDAYAALGGPEAHAEPRPHAPHDHRRSSDAEHGVRRIACELLARVAAVAREQGERRWSTERPPPPTTGSRRRRPAPGRSATGWTRCSSYSATWLSGAWVDAFAVEFSNIYYLDPARRDATIALWRGESEKHVRFFVAMYVPEERGNDLEKPGTLWSLRLVRADEKDFAPDYVREASMRPEEISRFFPYSGTRYRAYEVAFPKEAGEAVREAQPGTPRFKMVLSGVQGRGVLAWE